MRIAEKCMKQVFFPAIFIKKLTFSTIPNPATHSHTLQCLNMLQSCTSMLQLHQIQAHMTKTALDKDSFLASKLVSFCAISCHGDLNCACSILTHMEKPHKFIWNTIIRGFSQSKTPQTSFFFYKEMQKKGLLPDQFTFPFALKVCSRLFDSKMGQQIHCQIIKIGPLYDLFVDTNLAYFYASCGEIDRAHQVFVKIPKRNVVTCNAMISGCARSGRFEEALGYFQFMKLVEHEKPDSFSIVSAASACASLGAFSLATWIHGYVYRSGLFSVVPLANSLLDMYAKCGSIDDACRLFDEMDVRNVVSWTSMIDACAMHGHGRMALDIFSQMLKACVRPDDMTFTSMLCAFSHAGMLEEGKLWFSRMSRVYDISPKIQHFGCMVDLLGRANRLEEAYGLIVDMPMVPDAAIWRALVGACLIHDDLELAGVATNRLHELDPADTGDLVIMSNVYARLGRWEDVASLRGGMRLGRARKVPSYSSIEVNGVIHEFVMGDKSHLESQDMYLLLNQMVRQLRCEGYVSNTSHYLMEVWPP